MADVQAFLAWMVLLLYGVLQLSLWITEAMFGEDFWEGIPRG